MSSAGSIDFSPLDSSTCRILTVSATLDRAVTLVDRIRNLRSAAPAASTSVPAPSPTGAETQTPQTQTGAPTPTTQTQTGTQGATQTGLGASTRIPWTLSNKYYSADVHFAAHTVTGLAPHAVRNVPAVVFVWARGEAYKHHVERLAGDMSGYEPEVALAVRVAPGSTEPEDKEDGDDAGDEDADIDEFLSSNGFEFIDASQEASSDDAEPFSQGGAGRICIFIVTTKFTLYGLGIPGLPRVLDALSTIMWPSMQAKAKPTTFGVSRLARRDDGFEWATRAVSQDDDLSLSPIKKLTRGGSREQEMEELTRWLEEDDGSREDPWRAAAVASSPTDIDAPESANSKGFGFDDDFTVFVSAPPVEQSQDPDDSFELDSPIEERLGAPGTGPLYLSLGSGLDLRLEENSVEENVKTVDDEEDEDLPTDAEIEAMSSRIFGDPMRVEGKMHGPDADGEYDMAAFDLSRVMSALEGMKAEISSMADEGERRKAAARVALGLVYGLEADAGDKDL
ncbi:hypothetical protein MSAN_01872000 [Mycena sanguinolenta]|uniref:Alpha/gamma-adaptin-binding protein p34 n=1 Tax=Mycena sanguinolenta TaxID=230812 RepID=A0A8H6XR12_9AGAR|nr:hypothetical protein MSAN_01872000 [Mycena sanguinolenta]